MKVYLNKEYKCVKVEDNTFVANDSSNYIRYYFVTNANGDVIDKMDDTSVIYRNTEPSYVTVAFRRADGNVIQHLMASPKTDVTGNSFFEYEITDTDGILYKKGALEISAQFIEATLSETGGVKKVISQKVKAIAINTAHVLDNIGEEAEEYYSQYEQANNDAHAVLQAQITTNFNNIGTLQDLTTDAKDDLVKAINEVDAHADANKSEIGDLSTLTTDEKTTIVGAINEVDAHADANKAEIGALSALTTDEKATLVGAINEVDNHADNATTLANNAVATANNAVATANEAKTTAQTAETNANSAVDTANAANATADEAKAIAQGSQRAIGFATLQAAITALNGYSNTQLKVGDNVYIVETGVPDLWVAAVEQNSVAYNYTTNDAFNDDLVENTLVQVGYYKFAYLESDGKPCTVAWQNMTVAASDWVASTEFEDFAYEAKIALTDFVNFSSIPQVVFGLTEATSGNYAPICKAGDKGVYIYSKVNTAITLPTVVTFAPNVHGASMQGGGYTNKGKWVASTTYAIDDLVYTDNGQYVCIEGITSTTSPEQDTQHWQATFVATGKTKNGLTISGQDNGTGVQKTFDGSQAVEIAFDETTMTAKEVDGVLKVGAKGTIPEALPQTAEALKSGKLPTSGWDTTPKTLYDGPITYGRYGSGGRIYENFLPPFEYSAHTALSDWQGTQLSGNSISNVSALEGGVKLAVRRSDGNDNYVLRIYNTGTVNAWTYNDRDTNGAAQIKVTFLSNWLYTISDTSITANSDVLMELTDDGGVKSYSMEAGKITVFRGTLPTQAIPYTYKVKQTNASGQFTLVNHYVPEVPESPTSLPVTYKKASGELPTSGWNTLDEGWKQNTLPANTDWKSVTYGDGKYVAVTFYSDKGAYSTDGVTWTEMSMPAVDSWIVTYGNGKYVALASGNTKGAYSTNGITWTEMSMPTSRSWNGLTYGNGKFVAVAASSDKGAYSTDGVTWTEMSMPTSRDWASVTYGDGKFVAVVVDSLYGAYSADGISWTEMSMPASRIWRRVAYGNGKFVAVGSGSDKGAYSTDGISWTEMSMPTSRSWIGLTYGDDKFVAVAYNSDKGAYSIDGITWTETTLPASIRWNDVTYGDGEFVAVSQSSANGAYWKAAAYVTYTISDTDITANTSVKMYLTDEGGVKAYSKAVGSIQVIRDSVPTTAIPYKYEVEQTSTPGGFDVINSYVPTVPTKTSQLQNDSNFATTSDIPAKTSQLENDSGFITSSDIPIIPTKTSQLENDSNFAKTNTPNSWGSTQTFTAYDGIKTNRICNAAGTSLVDGTGTTNKFGNGNMPTIIKTSEARPKAEVPYADGTATREIALLEDIPSMVIDWVGPSATEQVITGTGMRQIFAEFTDTVGDVSTVYKFYGEVYVDGQNEVNGTSSTVYSTNTEGTELHVITVTPTIRRNTDNQFVLRAECCRYTIGASPMSINKSYLSFVFRKRLY
nr:MAG TPA: Photosynthesis system II assembly factor YCF48 [Caudoviricetes sp.]